MSGLLLGAAIAIAYLSRPPGATAGNGGIGAGTGTGASQVGGLKQTQIGVEPIEPVPIGVT